MTYHETCPCCGHQETAYSHKLNEQIVKALSQLVHYYMKTREVCNLQKHLILTKNQYNNFQKLQYFGLVYRAKGGWFPTQLGKQFIFGELVVQIRQVTFRGKALPYSHEAWEGKFPDKKYVFQISETAWKKREEYALEKSNQLHLI